MKSHQENILVLKIYDQKKTVKSAYFVPMYAHIYLSFAVSDNFLTRRKAQLGTKMIRLDFL